MGVVGALSALHHGFLVKPWHRSVAAAIRKEPKWFLRDWSRIEGADQRAETFVGCHLLKAVEGWTDLGHQTPVVVPARTFLSQLL